MNFFININKIKNKKNWKLFLFTLCTDKYECKTIFVLIKKNYCKTFSSKKLKIQINI